jgi:hypothetical protein
MIVSVTVGYDDEPGSSRVFGVLFVADSVVSVKF